MAAMELYVERGFEQTTVAEIADRAGLTARTFFRYFADKREVLFLGATSLQEQLVGALDAAPASASSLGAVSLALETAADLLGQNWDYAQQRQSVIMANSELRERELIKMANLAVALGDALRRRGVTEPEASLAAEAGVAVLRVAFERWVSEAGAKQTLAEVMRGAVDRLRSLTAAP
jgi:AcrR family transcriptional regulator